MGYQPDVIDHEVNIQGFSSDFDDHPFGPPVKVKRTRRKKKNHLVKAKMLLARIPKRNPTKQ